MLTVSLIGILLSVLVSVFFEPMLGLLNAKGILRQCFYDYFRSMMFEYPLMIFTTSAGMFIRADGKPQFSMLVTFVTVALNIVLDYVFSVMGQGIRGIAFASVISGCAGVVLSLFFFRFSSVYKLVKFRFDGKAAAASFANGSSEFISEMASCVSMFCYNYVIMRYVGESGVASFTVAGYMIFIFSMIVLGFGQGMFPLVSFCHGAGDYKTSADLRKLTERFIFAAGLVFSLVLFFGGKTYAGLFVQDESVIGMTSYGLKIFTASFMVMGFNFIGSMYFTACGKALPSAVISSARGIVILLILIFTLPAFLGITGVWLAAPVTEVLTLIITAVFLKKEIRC